MNKVFGYDAFGDRHVPMSMKWASGGLFHKEIYINFLACHIQFEKS